MKRSMRAPALLSSPDSNWIFNAVCTRRSSTLKVPMAIFAGETASSVDFVLFALLSILNVLAAVVVDHMEKSFEEEDTWFDAVSIVMAAGLLCVQAAACWYQIKIRDIMDAYSSARCGDLAQEHFSR